VAARPLAHDERRTIDLALDRSLLARSKPLMPPDRTPALVVDVYDRVLDRAEYEHPFLLSWWPPSGEGWVGYGAFTSPVAAGSAIAY
jgi:hypothetical protein